MSSSFGAHTLCRVCAVPFESSTMFRLFNERNEPLPIAEAFWRVSEIEIQAEDLRFPQSCCPGCRNRLQEVEELRALCLESDRKLRKMIGFDLKEEEEEEGDDMGMGSIGMFPKVEIVEASESSSWWNDAENRFDSDKDGIETETLSKVKQSRRSKKPNYSQIDYERIHKEGDKTQGTAEAESGTDNLDPEALELKSKRKSKKKTKSEVKGNPKASEAGSDNAAPQANSPKTFQCTLCGKIYKSSKNLKEHETSHFPDRMNHKCHICSQEFARRNYYLVHLKMHQTENQFKCTECDKTFSLDKLLQEHISIQHRRERPFQCKLCPKAYPRASTLHTHVKTIHEKIRKKLYRCEKCTMSFVNKYAYDRHMNGRHEGLRLHQCPHCGNNYELKSYVQQHIAEKHPETVENLSRCQYCGMGYCSDGYYRKHIVKRHPEHLEAFDQWVKAKREAMLAGPQSTSASGTNISGSDG